MPAATAAADPPDEPPGRVIQAPRVAGRAERQPSVTGHWPNSRVFVLPTITAPAALQPPDDLGVLSATGNSPGAAERGRLACEVHVVLDRDRHAEQRPRARRRPAAGRPRAASASAASARTRRKALSVGWVASIRARRRATSVDRGHRAVGEQFAGPFQAEDVVHPQLLFVRTNSNRRTAFRSRGRRWTAMNAEQTTRRRSRRQQTKLWRVPVVRVARITPHLARITVGGEQLADFTGTGTDQNVLLYFYDDDVVLPEPLTLDAARGMWSQVRPTMRSYTISRHDPAANEIDFDFVLHGDEGPRVGVGVGREARRPADLRRPVAQLPARPGRRLVPAGRRRDRAPGHRGDPARPARRRAGPGLPRDRRPRRAPGAARARRHGDRVAAP